MGIVFTYQPLTKEHQMSIMLTTPEQIKAARLLAIRSALKFEVQTGMKMTRGRSVLTLAREAGMTTKRNKAAALVEVNAFIAENYGL